MIRPTLHRIKILIVTLLTAGAVAGLAMSVIQRRDLPSIDPAFPVRGIDISSHNGDIDFEALSAQGIRFALIKATEGSTFKDPAFHTNYSRARRAGMLTGAYHFFRFETPGHMQAINLLNSVRGRRLDFPLIIDIEEWGNPYIRPTEEITASLREMIDYLTESGYPVMIYTNKDGHTRFIDGRFDRMPLWICSLNSSPANTPWTIWQYSHTGGLRGLGGNVDLNTFRGDERQFDQWVESHRPDTQY